MAQEFEREVVVCVWEYGGPTHPGHAAMKFYGVPGLERELGNGQGQMVRSAESKGYISFWPGGGKGAHLGNAFSHIRGKVSNSYQEDKYEEMGERTARRLENRTYDPTELQHSVQRPDAGGELIEFWLQRPHHKIHIPGAGNAGMAFGLDLAAIFDWWQIFTHSPDLDYKFVSKKINCAGVILTALLKGGAGQFAERPNPDMFVEPNDIRDFARAVRRRMDDMNADANWFLIEQNEQNHRRHEVFYGDDVMTYQEWKNTTSLNGAYRSHVADIDNALKRYHAGKGAGGARKVELLGAVLKAVRIHTMRHPLSRRSHAVLTLGKQCIEIARLTIRRDRVQGVDWFTVRRA